VRFSSTKCGVLFVLVTITLVAPTLALQIDPGPLQITVHLPQTIVAGENFNLPLTAQGGFAPYTWSRIAGDLPPGLKLHSHTGILSGVPTTPGEYHFTLAVVDSTVPQQQAQRDLTIIVIAGLTIDWKQPPQVQGNTLAGSVVVSNQTQHGLDITLIVVAVNSIGRSTALGYQHFTLAAEKSSPIIPFGSSPGSGTYTVRADAAAHRKSGHFIFRASKQTPDTLQVTQF
jgi:putative Ig domain-containing protein